MKLTKTYLRKLIMEQLLKENLDSAAEDIQKMSEQTSPFIKIMNQQTFEDNKLKVLEMFLNKLNIENKNTFYTKLGNMAYAKAKEQKESQVAKQPAQPEVKPPVAKGITK